MGEDYLLPFGEEGECALILMRYSDRLESNRISLGAPFLRAYYSIYDMEENRVGLAPIRYNMQKS